MNDLNKNITFFSRYPGFSILLGVIVFLCFISYITLLPYSFTYFYDLFACILSGLLFFILIVFIYSISVYFEDADYKNYYKLFFAKYFLSIFELTYILFHSKQFFYTLGISLLFVLFSLFFRNFIFYNIGLDIFFFSILIICLLSFLIGFVLKRGKKFVIILSACILFYFSAFSLLYFKFLRIYYFHYLCGYPFLPFINYDFENKGAFYENIETLSMDGWMSLNFLLPDSECNRFEYWFIDFKEAFVMYSFFFLMLFFFLLFHFILGRMINLYYLPIDDEDIED